MNSTEAAIEPAEKSRGVLLTLFLGLALLANPVLAVGYLTTPETYQEFFPGVPLGVFYGMGMLCLVNILLVTLIWCWKRVGVYGFYASTAVAFILNLYLGVGVGGAISGLLGAVVLFLLVRKRWYWFS